jgi:hypothetical protein
MAAQLSKRLIGRISPKSSMLFVCDIQEKFRPVIDCMPSVIHTAKTMMKASQEFKFPIVVTEQYPKGLGKIVSELEVDSYSNMYRFEKLRFSMVIPQVASLLDNLKPQSVMIVGIEVNVPQLSYLYGVR